MKQLSRLLLATLLLTLAVSVAHAVSLPIQIKPDKKEVLGYAFAIKAERLKDGSFQFNVVITPNDGKKFGPGGTYTGLSIVNSTPFPPSFTGGRSIDAKKSDQSITCVFTVTAKELADQNFSFIFNHEPNNNMPALDMFYARLADFIKP
jgi:hypothetical protein